jgi:hypothetical protein
MAWTWRLLDASGADVDLDAAPPSFPNQSDAESWLGEEWPELLAAGIDGVVLLEDEREVYGPMSLQAPPS